ncbi:MAG: hypothetical protein PHI97_33855 [Desulfobulbus sp.]|nr:hypothetical protein [Desulfobulbus sp.]
MEKNERIIGAEIRFQAVHLKAVFNIPPLWDTDIDLNVPTNPAFSGAIINGAAALGTTRELPEFEISRHATDSEPSVLEASIEVTKYPPGDPDLARRIKVVMVRQ